MYEEFFNLDELPFAVPPDPGFLYLTDKHRKALNNLEYGIINKAAISVITGGIGSGKTTIIRELMRKLEDDVVVGMVSNVTINSFSELMQLILYAFELEYRNMDKVELFDVFTDFIISTYAANKRAVLIIDEAQNLDAEIIEQLRMLTNINADKHQVFQLILAGQPNLWDVLRQPALVQFVQRIEVDFFLDSLSSVETKQYIQHRLKVSGGDVNLFEPDTYELIWSITGGVPRIINILCGFALVYAFADNKKNIDRSIIELVKQEKMSDISPYYGYEEKLRSENSYLPDRHGDIQTKKVDVVNASPVKSGKTKAAVKKPRKKGLSSIEKLFK